MTNFSSLRVHSERMLNSFEQLAQIGATGDGGVNRPALSEAHLTARRWFRAEAESAGLEFHVDGAGNHSAHVIANEVKQSPNAGGIALTAPQT